MLTRKYHIKFIFIDMNSQNAIDKIALFCYNYIEMYIGGEFYVEKQPQFRKESFR